MSADAAPSGNRLFIKKSVDQIQREAAGHALKRTLGPINLVFLGIGCIIGAGIYVMTGNMITTPCGTFTYPETKKVSLRREEFKTDHSLMDPLSDGYVAKKYTKAYVAHLFRAGEILGPHLASIHNLHFIVSFTENLRKQLLTK